MSCKFDDLRRELDSLGYPQRLMPECIPLVQKLVADLHTTTENLQKYMKISQRALEERDSLELGAEPYKCDNAKLIKECNDLHIAFIHFKDQHEKIQRELRFRISSLQTRLDNCNLEKSKLMSQIQQLEKEKYRRGPKTGPSRDQGGSQHDKNFKINSAVAAADEKIVALNKELQELSDKHLKVSEDNAVLQNQLASRDEEIARLYSLVEGGKTYKQISKECCYKNVDGQIGLLQDEATRLKREKNVLQIQVKEALSKQHEAMRRALHLAERNKQLEKEMKDIDEIALAVETECNSAVKEHAEKVSRLQDRVNESLILIQNLERDVTKLKQVKLELSADLDAVQLAKSHLKKQLEKEIEDKKRLTDRINNFTIIENDLNLEIDRLTKLSADQKRKIAELEAQLFTDKAESSRMGYGQATEQQGVIELRQQLKEKETVIKRMECEIGRLNAEVSSVIIRGQEMGRSNGVCENPNCKRKERDLDVKSNELRAVEMENNSLKSKIQAVNETTVFNEERIKKAFQDMEEHIRKLEDERRNLVKTELTQRSNISQLEEEHKCVKEQLRQAQNELANQKNNYNQLKLLHEQTDRALAEAQARAMRFETDLATYQSRIKDSTRETQTQDKEVARLTSDVQIMKNQLTKIDREKDELLNSLDEKTEKIAMLEEELDSKTKTISKLEGELKDLRRKLSKSVDESSSRDHIVRSKEQELNILERDYEKERKLKEAAVLENKRLQSDLASVTCDCRDARHELEISRRQVDDLKRQLQHYVAEVKRTEDLISQKEVERNELLDQFRCLSQEANILENNNQSLETEATQSKIQLSVALDHTTELERRIADQQGSVRSYENQIKDLSTQVARLEMQLKQNEMEQEQCNAELKQMRDLCLKLDKDKDGLKHELYSRDDGRVQVEKVSEKLKNEKDSLHRALEKERHNLEGVERLLNEARQEVIDQRLLNDDLQKEVDRLKRKIEDLQDKVKTTSDQLEMYQEKALEYSQLNKQLRRDMANERFSKSRTDRDKGYYPSL